MATSQVMMNFFRWAEIVCASVLVDANIAVLIWIEYKDFGLGQGRQGGQGGQGCIAFNRESL